MNSLRNMAKLGAKALSSAHFALFESILGEKDEENVDIVALSTEFGRIWVEKVRLEAENEALKHRLSLLEPIQAEVRVHPESQQHVYGVKMELEEGEKWPVLIYRDVFGGYSGATSIEEWVTWARPQL